MSAQGSSAASRVDIAIAVVERDGRFLIGKRGERDVLAGYWEFPGGKIERGESPAEAAIRECLEETGLAIRVTGQYATIVHDYDHGNVRLHFLACATDGQLAPLPASFRWVPKNELPSYRFPPANAGLLELLTATATA